MPKAFADDIVDIALSGTIFSGPPKIAIATAVHENGSNEGGLVVTCMGSVYRHGG